jgi:hypothetical protein
MKPVDQIISSLRAEPELWKQGAHTLSHKNGTEVWTANLPYLDVGIYNPSRRLGLFDKIRLQLAINTWHKEPLILEPK